jgi:UDP-galactopyranose mutase
MTKGIMLLYRRYQKLAYAESPNVTFGGRLGEYRYLDMDNTIERALRLSNDLLAGVPGGCSH